MGVAGCGKSAVGRPMATQLALPFIEGDDFHPPRNIHKMEQGVPLTDLDRADWLQTLGTVLAHRPAGAVLACSALKRAYRDTLRAAAPGLRFIYLAITQAESVRRVTGRDGHFYPPSLVASQFEALQDPTGEPDVLTLDGTATRDELAIKAVSWLKVEFNNA